MNRQIFDPTVIGATSSAFATGGGAVFSAETERRREPVKI